MKKILPILVIVGMAMVCPIILIGGYYLITK